MSSVVFDSHCLIFFCKAHFRFVFCSLAGKIILFRAWPGPCLLSKANFSRRKWFFVFNDLRKKIVSSTKSWSSRVVSTPAPANSSEPLTPPFCKKITGENKNANICFKRLRNNVEIALKDQVKNFAISSL